MSLMQYVEQELAMSPARVEPVFSGLVGTLADADDDVPMDIYSTYTSSSLTLLYSSPLSHSDTPSPFMLSWESGTDSGFSELSPSSSTIGLQQEASFNPELDGDSEISSTSSSPLPEDTEWEGWVKLE